MTTHHRLGHLGMTIAMVLASASATQTARAAEEPAASAIDEVTVTARRREESLQEVPLSIIALGTEQLEARGIESTENLNRQVPNLSVASTGFFGRQGGSFRMRGLPGVAIYVDGIVNSGTAGQLGGLVEMERVEVLRGPQGTLFGKNAIGGAIQYVTRKPADTFGARVKATVGSYDRFDVSANVDIPLSDTFLTKVTAAKLSRDGYLPSTTVQQSFGSQIDTVGRVDLLWMPTDRLDWSFAAEYNRQGTNGNPSTVWALNPVCAGQANVPANFPGGAPNNPCIYNALAVSQNRPDLAINQQWVYGAREEWKTASNYSGPDIYTTTKSFRSGLDYELSDAWAIKALAGYRWLNTTGYADFDGTPTRLFDGGNYSEREETSAELQLAFTGERLTGVVGAYYYGDDNVGRRQNWIANEINGAVNPALSQAARTFAGIPGTGAYPGAPTIDSLAVTETSGWAIFSEWSWKATDRLSLTLGARYNEDDLETQGYVPVTPIPAVCCTLQLNVDRTGTRTANSFGEGTFSNVSPRFSVQYQWTPDVMTYFTYSQGFGNGGVNTNPPTAGLPPGVAPPPRTFDPETLDNFELGLRSELFDGRLRFNASAFLGKYEDIQISIERVVRFPTTENAGKAEVKGVEVEGLWAVTDNFLINYAAGYLDSGFTGLAVGVQGITKSTPFVYAPETSFSVGGQYDWTLASGAGMSFRADYGWQDDQYTGLGTSASLIPAYGLLGARLSYQPSGGNWDVALFGANLTDEFYRINGFFIPSDQMDNGTVGRPREWGLTFSFNFE